MLDSQYQKTFNIDYPSDEEINKLIDEIINENRELLDSLAKTSKYDFQTKFPHPYLSDSELEIKEDSSCE